MWDEDKVRKRIRVLKRFGLEKGIDVSVRVEELELILEDKNECDYGVW